MKHSWWCLVLLLAAPVAEAHDWAQWRGPEQNGISRDRNLPAEWSLDGKNLVWKSEIGGRATPIVQNGRVYLNCRTEHDVNDPVEKIHARQQVVCWDAATGEILWRHLFPVAQTDIAATRVGWASMAGDPETDTVFVHTVDDWMRCYDSDGEIVWQRHLGEEFGKISGYGGRTMTPVVDEDRVIVSCLAWNWGETGTPPPKNTYFCFDKRDGRLLWSTGVGESPEDTIYSVPVVMVVNGVRQLVGGNADGAIYGVNARDGRVHWSMKISRRGLNATPATDGRYVYMSHGEDNNDNVAFGRVTCIDPTVAEGNLTDNEEAVRWRVDGIKAGYTALLVHEGILYVMSDTGKLYAFDADNGEILWEQALGTVGKGSPVWGDGKLYCPEVNGNWWILKPSREGCEVLSRVQLSATGGKPGNDEIYASPVISNGRIYLVSRDRTICIAEEGASPEADPLVPLPDEAAPQPDQVAQVKLVPFEVTLEPGQKVEYELWSYDNNGHIIKRERPAELVAEGLPSAKIDGHSVLADNPTEPQAGVVQYKQGDLTAHARIRIFPPLPWKWDFEGFTGTDVPPTWVQAKMRLQPREVDETTALIKGVGRGRPSANVWLGPPTMKNYEIQADFYLREQRRQLASVGITNQKYSLILKANTMRVGVQSWQAHLRMAKEVRFRADPEVWYRLKLRVDMEDDQAIVRGKVWPRDQDEPEEWTVEATDPHPNTEGSPGLYFFSLAEAYVDNVEVTPRD